MRPSRQRGGRHGGDVGNLISNLGGLLANTEDGHSAMCLVSTIVYTASKNTPPMSKRQKKTRARIRS